LRNEILAEIVVPKKRVTVINKDNVYLTGLVLGVTSVILGGTSNASNVTLARLPSQATTIIIVIIIVLQRLVTGSVHVVSSSSRHALPAEVVEMLSLEITITTKISRITIQITMEDSTISLK